MYREDEIREALKWLKVRFKATVKQLAIMADCSPRHIQGVLSGKEQKCLSSEAEYSLARFFDVEPSWFVRLGHALANDQELKEFYDHLEHVNPVIPDEGEASWLSGARNVSIMPAFTLIPKYKARLSGGHGSLETSDQIETNLAFRTEFVKSKGNPDRMALFEVCGDSMEPFIYEKDVVLVDMSQNDFRTIVDGKAYAFREDQTVKVKRLSWQGAKLLASSENEKRYPPYHVDVETFNLIGRVIWLGHEVK